MTDRVEIYVASRAKFFFMFAVVFVFGYGGYEMWDESRLVAVAGLLFFGFGEALIILYIVVPERFALIARPQALEVRFAWKTLSIPWADIDRIYVSSVRSMNTVVIAYKLAAYKTPISMPAMFNRSAQDIVGSLNIYKSTSEAVRGSSFVDATGSGARTS